MKKPGDLWALWALWEYAMGAVGTRACPRGTCGHSTGTGVPMHSTWSLYLGRQPPWGSVQGVLLSPHPWVPTSMGPHICLPWWNSGPLGLGCEGSRLAAPCTTWGSGPWRKSFTGELPASTSCPQPTVPGWEEGFGSGQAQSQRSDAPALEL